MSRIQQILEKAERDGATLRTHGVGTTATPLPAVAHVAPVSPAAIEREPLGERGRSAEAVALHTPMVPVAPPLAPVAPIAPVATATPVVATVGATTNDPQQLTVRLNPLLVAGLAPQSLAAEQYRQLRTRLSLAEGASSIRTVLITSPQKGEGKSLTSANLALTMAQELQRRVVLIEADLRKPSLQQLFGLPAGPGLSDYLAGATDLQQAMRFLPDHHLTVIPAGSTPANPAELLGSTAMRRLLDQLRTTFDRVILDTPPVLPLADVAILAPMVDGALMVVRAGYTPKPAIENALRAFDSSRLLGVVLNESGLEDDYRYESTKH
jgi:capsular exopolysaccharide synthesis family protein